MEPSPNPSATPSSPARQPAQAGKPARTGKPCVSIAIATALGLGYIPVAPGTFGSLAGIVLATISYWLLILWALLLVIRGNSAGSVVTHFTVNNFGGVDPVVLAQILLTIVIALVGVITADRAAKYWGAKDPQKVVIDEVSGQHLTYLLAGFWPRRASPAVQALSAHGAHPLMWSSHPLGFFGFASLDWKYLLVGFILFRVFDIWKPFPARQAESLPGGLGIMADDWVAGIYAALGLWLARAFGL